MHRCLLTLFFCAVAAYAQIQSAAIIAQDESLSSAVWLQCCDPLGRATTTHASVIMPSAWTAARIAFRASIDGKTYYPVYDADGVRVSVAASAGVWIELPMSSLWAARYLRLESVDSSGNAVNQAAARTLTVVMR